MVVTLDLPDNIARALTDHSDKDLSRRALEGLAIEGYREQRLTQKQVGQLLGLTRIQTADFLAAHVDLYDYEPAALRHEARQLKDLSDSREYTGGVMPMTRRTKPTEPRFDPYLEVAGERVKAAAEELERLGIADKTGRRIRKDLPEDKREGEDRGFGG